MRVDHIGYAVKNVDAARVSFERLGFTQRGEKTYDADRKTHFLFMEKDGYLIELVSPADPSAPAASILAKVGNTPYHLCYEVASIEEGIKSLSADGYLTLQAPAVAPAMGGRRVAFLVHRDLGILELVESHGQEANVSSSKEGT